MADADDILKSLDEAREQAELAENGEYDSPEPRIWHCAEAIRKLADAISRVVRGAP